MISFFSVAVSFTQRVYFDDVHYTLSLYLVVITVLAIPASPSVSGAIWRLAEETHFLKRANIEGLPCTCITVTIERRTMYYRDHRTTYHVLP